MLLSCRGVLAQHTLDCGSGDPMALRDLTEALSPVTVTEDGLVIEDQRIASDVAAFETGTTHAGPDPLDDQVAL